METIQHLLQYILHIDTYLIAFVSTYGVIDLCCFICHYFLRNRLGRHPFLPGDSLLFAAGSIAANCQPAH